MRFPRLLRRRDEVPVVELQRSNPLRYGLVVIVVLAIVVYFGFTKHIPFKHGFRLKAAFNTVINIQPKSPVRIAGVDVGKVSSVKREGRTGVVTMEIKSSGLPIHSDATAKIRPRIFLEGNNFVDLQPGSPSAPSVSSGAMLPVTQTANPVQLDQVLGALNSDTRTNLQDFLVGYGEALTGKPTAAEDAIQDPEVRGLTGAQALNKAYHRGPGALRGSAVVNQAIGGTEPHDLSKLIASIGKVTAALNVHEQQLGELITNLNKFFAAFAAEAASLRTTVAELPGTLHSARRGLAALNASFPPTKAFANAIIPGVKQTNPTVTAALPWIEQVRLSLAPSELGGVAQSLASATPSLAGLTAEQTPFYKQTDLFNKCLTNVIIPGGNAKLQDGSATSGVENYKEFWYSLVGLAGIGQSFDGNGTILRSLAGNSGTTLRSAPSATLGFKLPSGQQGLRLLGRSPLTPLGTRPAYPAQEPAYQPLVPCHTQTLPNFNGPLASGPADGTG